MRNRIAQSARRCVTAYRFLDVCKTNENETKARKSTYATEDENGLQRKVGEDAEEDVEGEVVHAYSDISVLNLYRRTDA